MFTVVCMRVVYTVAESCIGHDINDNDDDDDLMTSLTGRVSSTHVITHSRHQHDHQQPQPQPQQPHHADPAAAVRIHCRDCQQMKQPATGTCQAGE